MLVLFVRRSAIPGAWRVGTHGEDSDDREAAMPLSKPSWKQRQRVERARASSSHLRRAPTATFRKCRISFRQRTARATTGSRIAELEDKLGRAEIIDVSQAHRHQGIRFSATVTLIRQGHRGGEVPDRQRHGGRREAGQDLDLLADRPRSSARTSATPSKNDLAQRRSLPTAR